MKLLSASRLTKIAPVLMLLALGGSTARASISISSACTSQVGTSCTITSGTRSAYANFTQSGSQLTVTLSNVTTNKAAVPVDVLTAVFFQVTGPGNTNPTLTKVSASLASGSSVLYAPNAAGAGTDMGPEWAYKKGITNAPGGGSYGISSTGLGIFGPGNRFNTSTNYQGPDSVGGLEYGIVSNAGIASNANTPLTGANALIKSSVVFTFSGLSSGSAYTISKIAFQYGTALDEPCLGCGGRPNVPEPSQLLISGLAALGVVALVLRRRQAQA